MLSLISPSTNMKLSDLLIIDIDITIHDTNKKWQYFSFIITRHFHDKRFFRLTFFPRKCFDFFVQEEDFCMDFFFFKQLGDDSWCAACAACCHNMAFVFAAVH